MKKKILLLNPPGKDQYIRDFYCSKVSKSGYLYTPVDFLYLSGYLKEDYDLVFIDCILEKNDDDELISSIAKLRPDYIISLTGYVSWKEDFALFETIKKNYPEIILIGSGDVLQESAIEEILKASNLDAILHDFSNSEICEFVSGEYKKFNTISYLNENNSIVRALRGKSSTKVTAPFPKHEIFPLKKYSYPFVKHMPFATVLTDYSCPYKCNFCIMSKLQYRSRTLESVIEELTHLKQMGIRDIYFADQTFGINKTNTQKLLQTMIDKKFDYGWVCFSRTDVTDADTMRLMKKAGCHTIIYGIEFGNDANLAKSQKNITIENIEKCISLGKKNKIRMVGTFLMGVPEQSEKDVNDMIKFSKDLDLDFASFNVFVPRGENEFAQLRLEDKVLDQSGIVNIQSSSNLLSSEQLTRLHKKALREFYLRFSFLNRRFFSIRSFHELKIMLTDGLTLVFLLFRKGRS